MPIVVRRAHHAEQGRSAETVDTDRQPEVASDSAQRRPAHWFVVLCLGTLLLGYVAVLGQYYAPAISHADANGYWGQGTLIAETGRATFRPESPLQYIGMHWLLTDSGVYVCRYPPGLPLAVTLASRLFGPEASVLLNPILAVMTLLGVFLLTRSLVGPGWGVLTALTLALNPVFNVHALNSISHMAVAALLVWGCTCWCAGLSMVG
jgi:4-amino-4-deoxy-L-arabinose transferase-like glycosyltransferase